MALRVSRASAPEPVRAWTLPSGVHVSLLRDGDGKHIAQRSVTAHLVGRLPNGCIFESTEGKGGDPMAMQKGSVIPGMDLAMQELTLGSIAEIRIPSELAYGKKGIPRIVPPDCELIFEVHILEVDGILCAKDQCDRLPPPAVTEMGPNDFHHPWWLARVELPAPPLYYLNFCTQTAKQRTPVLLENARSVARRSSSELTNFDVGTAEEPFIITDAQREWRARGVWNLQWFKDHLGDKRQLLKWLGPVFTRQESLWEAPVYETSVKDYINYMEDLEKKDPDCEEHNAAQCPRLYLNGWPAFAQLPWLRGYVLPDGATTPAASMQSIEDLNSLLIRESEALRESLLEGLTARGSYQPPDKEEQTQKLENEDWDLTKIFMSPKGAITRLHYDNGGAHAWLSQVQGRKMFVCFAPSDGEHLHPFEGDEGLLNGSWLDPLDPEVFKKWPDAKKATPYVAVVEAGETIVAPKGWWHYAVSLDSSVTIMRNFYSTSNQWDLIRRKDGGLANAIATHVLRKQPKLKNQPDSVINEIATKTVLKLRETFVENRQKLVNDGP